MWDFSKSEKLVANLFLNKFKNLFLKKKVGKFLENFLKEINSNTPKGVFSLISFGNSLKISGGVGLGVGSK